jgi:regulator of sigma E protease
MLINVLSAVFVLGVMIIFHELGHFIAAKYFNIRVDAFSIGFGKRLFGRVHGETDYRICALPLGGYVKMAGDSIGEGTGDPGEFLSHPRWQRFFVMLMGPVFNIILAVGLLTGLYVYRYQKMAYRERPAEVGWVQPDSPAAKAGIKPGDRLVFVDGMKNPKWESVELRVISSAGVPLEVTYERPGDPNGGIKNAVITPESEGKEHLGVAGWAPILPALVAAIDPGESADRAGIQPGDQVTAIDGVPILFRPQMSEIVQKSKGAPLRATIRRGGKEFDVTLTARYRDTPDGKLWRVGVAFQDELITKKLSLPQAFAASLDTNRTFAMMIFDLLGKLLERKVSTRSLTGVVGISKQAGDAVRQGPVELITLMAFISINLAIFNLLPIPILDGGQILMLLVEGTLRRDLSMAVKERIVTVGFVFLVLFAAYVTYMDIIKTLPPPFERFLP